jgi:hypothetical protein
MTKTLSLLDKTPDWIDALCREIDTLEFTTAFDCFAPNAVMAFGVKQITSAAAMQAFLVKIDGPLNIDHRILEVWEGATTTYVRGEAGMAKKEKPDAKVTAPFMWLFRRDSPESPFAHWFITAGRWRPRTFSNPNRIGA